MKIKTLFMIAIFMLAIGCTTPKDAQDSKPGTPILPLVPDDPGAASGNIDSVTRGNNNFAAEMYSILPADGNIFFSPWSIYSAFAMAYEGARGNTASEMQEALHFPEKDKRLEGFAGISDSISGNYTLRSANALWADKSYAFLDEYTDTVRNYYAAEVKNMDFQNDPERSREEINRWVEVKTEDKIKNLLPKDSITSLTRLVLTNAIYFKGKWAAEFDPENTKDQLFTTSSGEKVDVAMMVQKDENHNFMETEAFQAAELDYEGGTLSMLIILPREDSSSLEISSALISEIEESMGSRKIDLYLPKFKLEENYGLKPYMESLGIKEAFNENADFSGLDGTKDLSITAAVHKAFIDVNEEGTEAAAATAIVVGVNSVPEPNPEFKADHAFVFIIRQKQTGNILFMGRVADPR